LANRKTPAERQREAIMNRYYRSHARKARLEADDMEIRQKGAPKLGDVIASHEAPSQDPGAFSRDYLSTGVRHGMDPEELGQVLMMAIANDTGSDEGAIARAYAGMGNAPTGPDQFFTPEAKGRYQQRGIAGQHEGLRIQNRGNAQVANIEQRGKNTRNRLDNSTDYGIAGLEEGGRMRRHGDELNFKRDQNTAARDLSRWTTNREQRGETTRAGIESRTRLASDYMRSRGQPGAVTGGGRGAANGGRPAGPMQPESFSQLPDISANDWEGVELQALDAMVPGAVIEELDSNESPVGLMVAPDFIEEVGHDRYNAARLAGSKTYQHTKNSQAAADTFLGVLGIEPGTQYHQEEEAGFFSSGQAGGLAPPERPADGSNMKIPDGALEELAADPSPEARREFDEVFGKGAAARARGEAM